MSVKIAALKQNVHHQGYAAHMENVIAGAQWNVYVGNTKIGQFVFSDGHDGYAGFSNSFGVDCYLLTERAGKCVWGIGPSYHSRRNIIKDLIEYAIENGTLA